MYFKDKVLLCYILERKTHSIEKFTIDYSVYGLWRIYFIHIFFILEYSIRIFHK